MNWGESETAECSDPSICDKTELACLPRISSGNRISSSIRISAAPGHPMQGKRTTREKGFAEPGASRKNNPAQAAKTTQRKPLRQPSASRENNLHKPLKINNLAVFGNRDLAIHFAADRLDLDRVFVHL